MSLSNDDFLAHYGVKGMKWGVRKEEPSSGSKSSTPEHKRTEAVVVLQEKLKDGGSLTVYKDPPHAITRFLARKNKARQEELRRNSSFTLKTKPSTRSVMRRSARTVRAH